MLYRFARVARARAVSLESERQWQPERDDDALPMMGNFCCSRWWCCSMEDVPDREEGIEAVGDG